MIKQSLTTQRSEQIQYSLKKIAVLNQLMIYEYQQIIVDTDFKIPSVNNFARRIGKDCQAIKTHLNALVKVQDTEYAEEFTSCLWRVLDILCKLELEPLQEYAEFLDQELEKVGV